MKVLIIGANGFIGTHLSRYLSDVGDEVIGIVRHDSIKSENNGVNKNHIKLNINNRSEFLKFLLNFKPKKIFYLAAQSSPGKSWSDPLLTFEANVSTAINLFEALKEIDYKGCVLITGSSAEYALNKKLDLIDEAFPTIPVSPYGISKLAQDHMARLYFERYGLNIIRVRPFYLIGGGKKGDVCSDFARGIASIESGRDDILRVGNLSIIRDFLDVKDGVEAMVKIASNGVSGDVYNICSGNGYSLGSILDKLINLSSVKIKVNVDKTRIREIDEPIKIGNPEKLKRLGWKPRHDIDDTLGEILNFWRLER